MLTLLPCGLACYLGIHGGLEDASVLVGKLGSAGQSQAHTHVHTHMFSHTHTRTHTPCFDTRWLDYRQFKTACTGRSTLPCFTLPAALTCLSPNLCVCVSACGGQNTCCGFTLLKSAAQMCRHYECRLCAQTSLEPTEVCFKFQARSQTSQTANGTLNYREIR